MPGWLRALTTLALAGVALALALWLGQLAGKVTLTMPGMVVETALPIALAVAVVVLVAAYYLGQLALWLGGLPEVYRRLRGQKQRQATLDALATALTEAELGRRKLAGKALRKLTPTAAETPLAETVKAVLDNASLPELNGMLATPQTMPLAALMLARRAAVAGEWQRVRELTAQGLTGVPDSPKLLVLHLKALLNLGETAAASALLPQMDGQVPAKTKDLLAAVVKGPARPDMAGVDLQHPWVGRFKDWLATAEDTLPDGA